MTKTENDLTPEELAELKASKPIFTLTDTTEVARLWFALLPDNEGDMLGMCYRDSPEVGWKITYRFRYYKDEKVWGSEDIKNVYQVDPKVPEMDPAKLIEVFDGMVDYMDQNGCKVTKVVVNGGQTELLAAFEQLPFAHAKEVSA